MEKQHEDGEMLLKLLHLCESDPEKGLSILEGYLGEHPEEANDNFVRFAKASAYRSRFFTELGKRYPQEISQADQDRLFHAAAALPKEVIDNLEQAVREYSQIEVSDAAFISLIGVMDLEPTAEFLERLRPGRSHEILGWTKLRYFGAERIRLLPERYPTGDMPEQVFARAMNAKLSLKEAPRSAMISFHGTDAAQRPYTAVMLFRGFVGTVDKAGDAGTIGLIFIFDDGTYSDSIETTAAEGNASKSGCLALIVLLLGAVLFELY